MSTRSLNQVQLIGNLTRDAELRYTPSGTAVCTFGMATNRQWTTDSGEKKEDVEFHRIVSWQKLAEICGKYLSKGRKVYVQGRLQTRSWKGQDGVEKQSTEVVIDDMIMLDASGRREDSNAQNSSQVNEYKSVDNKNIEQKKENAKSVPAGKVKTESAEDVPPDDIPF